MVGTNREGTVVVNQGCCELAGDLHSGASWLADESESRSYGVEDREPLQASGCSLQYREQAARSRGVCE